MNSRLLSLLLGAINIVLGIVEMFLGVRFILKVFGANASAPFTQFIYDSTVPLLEPFRGIFSTQTFHGRFVFEFTTLFAIIAYALLAYIISELAMWISRSRD